MSIRDRQQVKEPNSIQIELTEGCNRFCDFCGLHAIRQRVGEYEHMPESVAHAVGQALGTFIPRARVELAMHGEPLAHPDHLAIIARWRSAAPKTQFMLATNGIALLRDMQAGLDDLYAAGVDIVMLDTYEPERVKLLQAVERLKDISVIDFYEELVPLDRASKGSGKYSPWANHGRKWHKTLLLMDDLAKRSGQTSTRVISNHAGNNPMMGRLAQPLNRVCTIPFREVTVAWNGNINLCCNDWGHEYTCGNIVHTSLVDIWYGEAFEAARRVLYQRRRGFNPCVWCNVSYGPRPGMLPMYDTPTLHDLNVIQRTVQKSDAVNGAPPKFALDGLPVRLY